MSHLDAAIPTMGHRIVQGNEEIQPSKGDPWESTTAAQSTAHKDVYDFLKSPSGIVKSRQEETEAGELPAGQYWNETDAIAAAKLSGLKGPQPLGTDPEASSGYSESEYRTYAKAGRWSFESVADPIEDVSVERFTYRIDPGTGDLLRLSNIDPNRKDTVSSAPDKPTKGSRKIGKAVPTGFGYSLEIWESTDEFGNSNRYQVKVKDPDDRDTGDANIDLGEGRGDFFYLGDGKYEHVPDKKTPFEFDPKAGAGDVIPLEDQGGSLIRISENQYQFVRDTYEPEVKEYTDEQGITRQFTQSASGTWTDLAPRAESGVIESGGRDFLQQTTGALSELAPRYDPEVTDVDGMKLLQQRSGQVGQLTPPNMDQIITQALVDGEYDKAFAFQDFRDRPSAIETFQTALAFARSPADQRIISSIARGITPVQPPPEGTIQRVGPQPDFLVQAYQDFQRRTQAGRAPTEEEATSLSARAAAGQTPETDTLQARLESMEADIARKDRESEARIETIFADRDRRDRESEARVKAKYTSGTDSTVVDTGDTGDTGATGASAVIDDPEWNAAFSKKPEETTGDEGSTAGGESGTASGVKETAERLTADQKEHFADFGAARDWAAGRGESQTTYGGNATAMIAAHKQSIVDTAEQLRSEQGETARDWIDFNLNPDIVGGPQLGRGLDPGAGMPGRPEGVDLQGVDRWGTGRGRNTDSGYNPPTTLTGYAPGTSFRDIEKFLGLKPRAGGGTVKPGEITVVGEKGPEIAMMPPGTHILPLGKATKQDIRAAQSTGRAYQTGGIVFSDLEKELGSGKSYTSFGDLPIGLQQIQRGRPITPSRGYLSRGAGLNLPSAQAMSNITPESRDVFLDLAAQAGIPRKSFAQELASTIPSGRRMPVARIAPISRRGVQ